MTLDECQKMKTMNSQKPKRDKSEPDQEEGKPRSRGKAGRGTGKDQTCYVFQSTGTCHRAQRCPFSHEIDTVADSDAESSNVLELLEEGGSSGPDSQSAHEADQPGPEQILSAAVIGHKNGKKKRKGGGGVSHL